MSAAELLTPAELLRVQAEEQPLSLHAQGCQACGAWMNSHRVLGNALQGLRTAVEPCHASPATEQAVLAAFRAQSFEPRVVEIPARDPRTLWRMSRFFEIGAYAAAAAAVIVGLFLGVRLLEDKKANQTPTQAQTVQTPQSATNVAAKTETAEEVASKPAAVKPVKSASTQTANVAAAKAAGKAAATEASTSDNSDYVAVMLCDPLICSGDEQVIRMEMPAMTTTADGSAGKPVLADVVIGDDGLVRAMRIVNQ
jgi:hypothetical protein